MDENLLEKLDAHKRASKSEQTRLLKRLLNVINGAERLPGDERVKTLEKELRDAEKEHAKALEAERTTRQACVELRRGLRELRNSKGRASRQRRLLCEASYDYLKAAGRVSVWVDSEIYDPCQNGRVVYFRKRETSGLKQYAKPKKAKA